MAGETMSLEDANAFVGGMESPQEEGPPMARQIPPSVQGARDKTALGMLRNEEADPTKQADHPTIEREANRMAKTAVGKKTMTLEEANAHAGGVKPPVAPPTPSPAPTPAAQKETTLKSLAVGTAQFVGSLADMAVSIPGGMAGSIAETGMYAEMQALGINRQGAGEASKAFGDYVSEKGSTHFFSTLANKMAEATGEPVTPGLLERLMGHITKWRDQGAKFIDTKTGHAITEDEFKMEFDLAMNLAGAKGLGKVGPKLGKAVKAGEALKTEPTMEHPIDPADGHPTTAAFEAQKRNFREATKPKMFSSKDINKAQKALTDFHHGKAEVDSMRTARAEKGKSVGAADPKLLALMGGATAGYLLAQAYPEEADKGMAFALGMSSLGIGPESIGKSEQTIGTLVGKGSNTLSVLENLVKDNPNHTEFPVKRLQEELSRPGVTKSEKELFDSVLATKAPGESITANDLVKGLHEASGRFVLSPRTTEEYAAYGLDRLGRRGEPDEIDQHPQEIIDELEAQLADPMWDERGRAPAEARFNDFPFTAEQARFHRAGFEQDLARAREDLKGMPPQIEPVTTIWNLPVQVSKRQSANHFSEPKYFAHTRSFHEGGVSHVVEMQSDLTQKMKTPSAKTVEDLIEQKGQAEDQHVASSDAEANLPPKIVASVKAGESTDGVLNHIKGVAEKQYESMKSNERVIEGATPQEALDSIPLAPMWKDWHKRLVREELARAARNGEPVVRFATADTVAKVEGWDLPPDRLQQIAEDKQSRIAAAKKELDTEVLDITKTVNQLGFLPDRWNVAVERAVRLQRKILEDQDVLDRWLKKQPGNRFVDRLQGIYDRYKGDVEKFLTTLGGKPHTDANGHTWLEVPTGIKPEEAGPIWAVDNGPGEDMQYFKSKEQADKAAEGLPPPKQVRPSLFRPVREILDDIANSEDYLKHNDTKLPPKSHAMKETRRHLESLRAELRATREANRLAPKGAPTRAKMFGGASTDMMKTIAGLSLGVAIANQFDTENPIVAGVLGGLGGMVLAHATPAGVKKVFTNIAARDTRIRVNSATEAHQTFLVRVEREVAKVGFAMNKMVPKKKDRQLIHKAMDEGTVAKLPANLQTAAKIAQTFYATIAAEAQKLGILDKTIADYSTHLWRDQAAAKGLLEKKQAAMSANSKFAKKRTFLTMKEGIAAGLEPLTTDISEVMAVYGNSMGRAMANKILLNDLKAMVGPKGEVLVAKAGKAPKGYVQIDSPQLRSSRVHPDIAPSLRFLFEATDPGGIMGGLNALNVALKRNMVSYSMFHAKSLVEAGIVAGHPIKAVKALGQSLAPKLFGVDKLLQELRTGGQGDAVDLLLRNGLKISFERGEPTDIDVGGGFYKGMKVIQEGMDKILPYGVGKGIANTYIRANHMVDNFMWGRLHSTLKLQIAMAKMETLYQNAAKRGMPISKEAAARMASSYTNDVFGGLNWQRLAEGAQTKWGRDVALALNSRGGRMAMGVLMFAPDWFLSTTRAFYKALPRLSDVKHPLKAARGLVQPINDVDLYRQQLLRLGFYYGTALNAINVATSGHPIWENKDPTRIDLGDGRTMPAMKHSFEAYHLIAHPGQTMVSKMGIVPKEGIEQLLGVEYLNTKGRMPPMKNRAQHLAKNFIPISAQQIQQGPEAAIAGFLGTPIYGMTEEQKRAQSKARRDEHYRKMLEEYRKSHGLSQ